MRNRFSSLELPAGRFYGRIESTRAISTTGIRLVETYYDHAAKLPDHSHERAHFCFVLEGRYRESYGRSQRTRGPWSVLYHPSGFSHSEEHDAAGRHLIVEMGPAWTRGAGARELRLDRPTELADAKVVQLAAELVRESHVADPESDLVIEGLLLELVAETSRTLRLPTSDRPPQWLTQARGYLHEHFAESFTMAEVAAEVGIHPAHLARRFRREFRCTAGEYLRRLRVRYACRHLATTDEPYDEIAAKAGFSDQSHMTRTIKRATGLTPARYRKAFGRR